MISLSQQLIIWNKQLKLNNMSDYEHKAGNGSLFRNSNKTPENNQPDYSGQIMLQDGKMQQIAGWVKEGQKGKFFSLKLSDPYVKEEGKQEVKVDEDLPF
jgi:hypothetical protein